MPREALIHIGMHKTGSTSIQRTFAKYADDAWRYVDLGHPNHSRALALAFRDPPAPRFVRGRDPAQLRKDMRRALKAQLALDDRSVILSAEDLSYFPADSIKALLGLLSRHVDCYRVLGYLREPTSLVSSSFQELLKRRLPNLDHAQRFPKYKKRLAPWVAQAGRENCDFVLFDRAHLRDGDLLRDFAHRVGVSPDYAVDHAASANEGMSAELAALIFAIRCRIDQDQGQQPPVEAMRRMMKGLADFGAGKLGFSEDSLQDAFAENADQIAWAEDALGCAFPDANLAGRLCFDNSSELRAYADTLGPQLADYCQAQDMVAPNGVEQDPVGALAHWVLNDGDWGDAWRARTAPSGAMDLKKTIGRVSRVRNLISGR